MAVMNVAQASLILRHGNSADWAVKNPILRKGELGAEVDTGLLKMGNGVSPFNDLQYINVTQAFVVQELDKKLDKSGGTVNGALTLNYTPMSATDAVTKGYVDSMVASAGLLKRAVVEELPVPAEVDENTIYMVKDNGVLGPDKYKEYLSIDGALTQIGDTSVDLNGYARTPDTFTAGNLVGFATDGSLIDLGVAPHELTIGVATDTTIGGVLSTDDDNSISVNRYGKMTLNRVSVNNLYVPAEDEFILAAGNSN